MDYTSLLYLLHRELKPALGCTEPIAIALCCAKAREVLGEMPEKTTLILSANVIKNAMGVGIPGTDMIGIPVAASMGILGGESEKGLRVLEGIPENIVKEALDYSERDLLSIKKYEGTKKLYIEVDMKRGSNSSKVVIDTFHDRFSRVEYNGEIFQQEEFNIVSHEEESIDFDLDLIYDFAINAKVSDLEFLVYGVEMNNKLVDDGLSQIRGLQIGKTYMKYMETGMLGKDMKTDSVMKVAAAVDSRMAGSSFPAMSNSGSGDQGITAIVPVYVAWEHLKLPREKLLRALVLSNLIPIYIKKQLGRLSALCGATLAAMGVSAAVVYLLGGDYEQIKKSINNNIGGISGLFCDGAKNSCALKVANAVDAAFTSALLAIENHGVTGIEGIVDNDVK